MLSKEKKASEIGFCCMSQCGCGFGSHIKNKPTSMYPVIIQLYINQLPLMSFTIENIKTWQPRTKYMTSLQFNFYSTILAQPKEWATKVA